MSPLGAGRRSTTACSVSRMPTPVLAETSRASDRVDADDVLDLLAHPVGLGGGQVDLVEDGDDLVVGVDGLVDVGEGLRLDALGGVDDQERALDGAHGAGDLVGEVDVAGRVDEVEGVFEPVGGGELDADGVGLDGDAALALDVHRVEHLLLHVAQRDGVRLLDEPVGEGGLAVVDMGDDGEVADAGEVGRHGGRPVHEGLAGDTRRGEAVKGGRVSRRPPGAVSRPAGSRR